MKHPAHVWTDAENAQEPLDRLREAYVEYLRGRTRPTSPETVDKYDRTLRSFVQLLVKHRDPLTLGSLTPFAVNRWISEQRQAGLSEHGIASRLSAVKVFAKSYVYEYLELTTCDLLRKVSRITPPEKHAPVLTSGEIDDLLASFDTPRFEDVRNRAFVAMLIATGARLSEAVNLGLADVDRVMGQLLVVGKGRKQRFLRLSPRSLTFLKEYRRLRPSRTGTDRLWVTATGAPLQLWGAHQVFRQLKRRSGVSRVHPHLLRHGFAQVALERGAERAAVQDMLGHASDVMTRRYSGLVRQTTAARMMPQFAPI